MSKPAKKKSFEEVQEALQSILSIAARFKGFKLQDNIYCALLVSSDMVEEGKEREALPIIEEIIKGVRATLRGFYRGSPKHFVNLLDSVRARFDGGLHKDIEERLAKVMAENEVLAKSQLEVDLGCAAELYIRVHEALKVAGDDQRSRLENRKQKEAEAAKVKEAERLAAEVKHVEAQRAIERSRRADKANSLRELASKFA